MRLGVTLGIPILHQRGTCPSTSRACTVCDVDTSRMLLQVKVGIPIEKNIYGTEKW